MVSFKLGMTFFKIENGEGADSHDECGLSPEEEQQCEECLPSALIDFSTPESILIRCESGEM